MQLIENLVYGESIVALEVSNWRDVGDFVTVHVVELHGNEVAVVRNTEVQTEQ